MHVLQLLHLYPAVDGVLVLFGLHYNKNTMTGSLNNRALILTVLETGKSSSRHWKIYFLIHRQLSANISYMAEGVRRLSGVSLFIRAPYS